MTREMKEKVLWMGFKFNCNFDSFVKKFPVLFFSGQATEAKGIWGGEWYLRAARLFNVVFLLYALLIFLICLFLFVFDFFYNSFNLQNFY